MTLQSDWISELQPDRYRLDNKESWKRNSTYWMNSPLRHVVDNDGIMDAAIGGLLTGDETVVDVGCGDGFLYRKIRKLYPNVTYIGLDFNDTFIDALSDQSQNDPNASFRLHDLERGPPDDLVASADVVFSFFLFLEIEDIKLGFSSCAAMLRKGGHLSVFTIEYAFLALAVSRDFEDLKTNLASYEDLRSQGKIPFTFQKIDLGDGESENLTYGSVFHSTGDFINAGFDAGFRLEVFRENIKTKKFHPKVYQYMEFTKQ